MSLREPLLVGGRSNLEDTPEIASLPSQRQPNTLFHPIIDEEQ